MLAIINYSYNEFDIYVHTFFLKCLENGSLEAVLLGHLLQI